MIRKTFVKVLKTFLRSKTIRRWRLVDLGDVGMYCFFDPRREEIIILPLTSPKGPGIIESMVSVSALENGERLVPHQLSFYREVIENGPQAF